jgi:hypothetical protein
VFKKISVIAAAVAVVACIGAGSASAATLYTSAAHTTPVAVGATFTATMPTETKWYMWLSEGSLAQECKKAEMSFKVTQNSKGIFKAAPSGSGVLWGECLVAWQKQYNPPSLTVSGNSISVGTNTDWTGATLENFSFEYQQPTWYVAGNVNSASGNPPANGMFIQQPTVAKAPVSIVLSKAPGMVSTGFGHVTLSAAFTFTGTAASWSFG